MANIVAEKTGLEAFLPPVPRAPRVVPIVPNKRADPVSPRTRGIRVPKTPKPRRDTPIAVKREAKRVEAEKTETPRDKTLRLGQARMKNALRSIRLLGNLSTRNYSWEAGEVQRMREVLHDAVNETFNRFERSRERQRLEDTFSLVNAAE